MQTREPHAEAGVAARPARAERGQLLAQAGALQDALDTSQLLACLHGLRAWLNLSEIVVAAGAVDTLAEAPSAASSEDLEWRSLYQRERFACVDPIVRRILAGETFVDRRDVIAEARKEPRHVAAQRGLGRFHEAARDYNRFGRGFALGAVSRGHLALCSVLVAGPAAHCERAARLLRKLQPVLQEAVARVLLAPASDSALSERELLVLRHLASGCNDAEIAQVLAISESTVRFHLGNIFEKFGARNRCHAVSLGFQAGLLHS